MRACIFKTMLTRGNFHVENMFFSSYLFSFTEVMHFPLILSSRIFRIFHCLRLRREKIWISLLPFAKKNICGKEIQQNEVESYWIYLKQAFFLAWAVRAEYHSDKLLSHWKKNHSKTKTSVRSNILFSPADFFPSHISLSYANNHSLCVWVYLWI